MESDERFQAFADRVRVLWPRYRTTDEELSVAVWRPMLSRIPPDVVGQAMSKQRADDPDRHRPNWATIYQAIGARMATGGSDLEILIMQYRRSKDRTIRQRFADKTDAEVWQYYIEARIYPILFGFRGAFRQDMDRAARMATVEIESAVASMEEKLRESGHDAPRWLADVGIPDRWRRAMEAHKVEAGV